MAKGKEKTCKASGCTNQFTPWTSLQKACSPRCALQLVAEQQAKEYKAKTRKAIRDFHAKDRTWQLRKTQEVFNAYIRERDKGLPCISCKREGGKMTAGHYKSVGAYPELRFEEDNVHGQCWWNCNYHRSGNIHKYRPRLIEKIGVERVEWLEGPHDPKKYTIDELIEIRETYKQKIKELKNG